MWRIRILLLLCIGITPSFAQPTFDNSGNGMLNGRFNFRYVTYLSTVPQGIGTGDLSRAIAIYGVITFDGNGRYSYDATAWDSQTSQNTATVLSGTYSISASGLGFLDSLLANGAPIVGLVSNGIFVGSATENTGAYNDLLVLMPVSAPTNSTFQGNYWFAYMNFPTSNPATARDALFQLNADSQGNIGALNINGYIGATRDTVIKQSLAGATYSFSGGVATLALGGTATSQTLITGSKIVYASPDGNFVMGGSTSGADMLIGVRSTADSTANLNGLYYQAGIEEDLSTIGSGFVTLDGFYGALTMNSGNVLSHMRILSIFNLVGFDFTFSDTISSNSDGTYEAYPGQWRAAGAGGAISVGIGRGPLLALTVALRAPAFSGSGVYLNPAGIVNSASSAPFTVGGSRGELMTMYGSGLASSTVIAPSIPFPTTLNGVQVMVNGRAAPIYYVSATQISAIIPYATEFPLAQITVVNNGVPSNAVTIFMSPTSPGVFTKPPGGNGFAAALHPDGSLVTPSQPAKAGETIAVFVTGLGTVSPAIPDGAAGPVDPLSVAEFGFAARIDNLDATVTYAGLAPQLAGLYQINVTVPSGAATDNDYLDIFGITNFGVDSLTSEAVIPVRGNAAGGSEARGAGLPVRPRRFTRPSFGRPGLSPRQSIPSPRGLAFPSRDSARQ
jgi:uncharacterized protein (TIGR03437 family)